MLTSLRSILKYRLRAVDGHVGRVRDFHFDNRSWALRHMAACTHVHLPWPVVLIEPKAIGRPDWVDQTVAIFHTIEEIRQAPKLSTEPPLERIVEERVSDIDGYIPHWDIMTDAPETDAGVAPEGHGELRSLNHLVGYRVYADDELVGHVHDFLADDDWNIRALVVRLELFIGERYVAVDTKDICEIGSMNQFVRLSVPRALLENAPEYNVLQQRQPDVAVLSGMRTSGLEG